jgi:hypothetical protein
MQKTIASNTEIHKRRLDTRLDVDNPAFVNVSNVVLEAVSLDIEFLQNSIFKNRDPAFFRLERVDQHFLLHASPFIGKVRRRRLSSFPFHRWRAPLGRPQGS